MGHIEVYCCLNPGNSTIFGALLVAINRNTGQVAVLEEIKIWDSESTSVTKAWPKIDDKFSEKLEELGLTEFDMTKGSVVLLCPPKLPWFRRDMDEMFGLGVQTVISECDKPEYNLGLIKDLLAAKKMVIHESCTELLKEAETYVRHRKTFAIPNDRSKLLIYCLRGILAAIGYTSDLLELVPDKPDDEKFLERVLSTPTFDETMQKLRFEKFGLLGEDAGLFPEDFQDL